MKNQMQTYYKSAKQREREREQHQQYTDLYTTLTNDKNNKEAHFFAYFLIQIQTLQEVYDTFTLLRDIDETLCHRLRPEDNSHYDVIRAGIAPLLTELKNRHKTITHGILSARGQEFLNETFINQNNPDRPEELLTYIDTNHVYSSRDYPHENSPVQYHSSERIPNGQHNKAHAYHDIITQNPNQKFILIDDIIVHKKGNPIYTDRHIPFPLEIIITEEDAIRKI